MIPTLPPEIPDLGPTALDRYLQLGLTIFGLVLIFAAFTAIVYSGYVMITSSGDQTKFAAGRKNLLWSIAGIILVTLSWFFVWMIYSFFSNSPPLSPPTP